MAVELPVPLDVLTCIACGARSRFAECPEGCEDVPLDLVEQRDLDAMAARVAALRERVAALNAFAHALADQDERAWSALQRQAHAALAVAVPEAPPLTEAIVEAWGCRACGRVDAPQPCLGVCVRRPVAMADATGYRELAAEADRLAAVDVALSAIARLAAQLTPRAGQERQTRDALAARARLADPS